ncbi:MAG: cation-translocating P-type ATPase [Cypionkella sp.]|uniref:cation-translocating P-type ATPase n=1 Tax=Cypionkella sp. TaxID=2811411 RepID=UPI002AB91D00|nr:cation-translocating P-type ATPase [Cypionkella sp.]MDZ4309166.1 cation-translocating P-type ATPase [Cypionkella sp.]
MARQPLAGGDDDQGRGRSLHVEPVLVGAGVESRAGAGDISAERSGQSHQHGQDRDLLLAAITWLGLGVALVDAFLLPLPWLLVQGALVLAYLAGGVPAGLVALQQLFRKGRLDIDMLMVVAALAAASVGAALEGAVLLALFSLSGALEHRAMGRARRAVEALMALRPDTALRLRTDGRQEEVAVAALLVGDRLVLRPGARVPVDGQLLEGAGAVDESTITGEAMPVSKAAGDALHEATVNLHGVLVMQVTRDLASSTVARMIALVTEAQAMKAPSERFSEWFGARYTVAVLVGSVLVLAVLLAMGWPFQDAMYRAATVLVAASPCAVVISVPAAILSALAAAARGGVLFKGGAALEMLAEVRAYAFDKTGTLTTGRAEVSELVVLEGDEAGFVALLAGIEAASEHHIAAAVLRAAEARGVVPVAVQEVQAWPSEGITGTDAAGALWAGNMRMAARMGADLTHPALTDLQAGAQTIVYLGRGPLVLGAVAVADTSRATAAAGVAALRNAGVRQIAMMTGDRREVALRIAAELGMRPEEVFAGLMPADKVRLVDDLAKQGRVAFVGDGVNDAGALARADVGIAMGAAGSEVALQAADVALLSDDMARLALAHRLARRTARVIKQNLGFALGAMLVLVVGGLFFNLPLPLAVIGHEGGTLLVVLNGLRLLRDPIRVG